MADRPDHTERDIERAERRERFRLLGAGVLADAWRRNLTPNAAYRDDAAILAFEAAHPNPSGGKSELIRQTFRCTEPRYYGRLYHLIHDDQEHALSIDAATVKRLLRLEERAAAARAERLAGVTNDPHPPTG